MTEAQAKAEAEVCARYCLTKLDHAIRFEVNPSIVRCNVKAIANYLHHACCGFCCAESDDVLDAYLAPLFYAKVILTEALALKPLNRDLVALAIRKLRRVSDRIDLN